MVKYYPDNGWLLKRAAFREAIYAVQVALNEAYWTFNDFPNTPGGRAELAKKLAGVELQCSAFRKLLKREPGK